MEKKCSLTALRFLKTEKAYTLQQVLVFLPKRKANRFQLYFHLYLEYERCLSM